ncbi:uncharacterized protein LOC111291766 isoform X5 [Durio zibethinus]|uniref:Uncharacterized protein LOC111291766 isoform X5 n=1 Tax=Durio zibethinus TaxID=66656 RepID=A0A6P5YHF2_DURZI|nr:uncharacterized protein LOC111291766 isoform X5 [Durio zibethinus]
MDLKGITWVGQVYQKFEAMCLEVEEVMYQDTVKYVEDQVQTVGASVKKFYSDVMQDVMQDLLLPSSSEPMKAVAASDTQVEKFAETLKKPNVGLKEATIKGEGEQLSEDSEVIADDNENAVNMPLSCRLHMVDNIFESCPQRFVERASSNLLSGEHSYNTLDKSNVENLPLAANYKVSCWQMPTTLTQVLAEEDNCDSIEQSCKEIESANSCSNAGMVSLIGCSINGDIQHNEFSDKIAFASSPGPVEEHPGQSNNWTMDTSGSRSSNVGRKEIETVLPLDKTRVDESCIMVNGAELHFHHQREGKHKPYQKKIRDAISSRMRSTRKKEYKQLALWYGDDVKSEQDCEGSSMLALKGGEDMRRSLTHDVLDSEWELL